MRLIDADELLKHKSDHEMISTHLIYNAPTIDAVPVIRCKDCKRDGTDSCGMAYWDTETDEIIAWNKPYEYCSRAERKGK